MCTGAEIAVAQIAFTAVSTGVGIAGAIQEGQNASKQASFQAEVQRQQAMRERQQAAADASDAQRNSSALLARRRAMLGGAGVEGGAGSPLLASEDFAGEAELQAQRIRSGGEARATRLEQSATLQGFAGRNAKTSGFIRGGSLLLSGAGKSFGQAKDAGFFGP